MSKLQNNVPRIRFKRFDDFWGIKKLKEIATKVNEKNRDKAVTETFTNSAQFGIISQKDFFDKDISNSDNLFSYYVVKPNDFVYNPRISNYAPVGPIKRNKLNREGVMSPLYYVFRIHSSDSDFIEHYFSTSKWHKFMLNNGDTGARSDRFSISNDTFNQMPILLPTKPEQTQIGNFFQKLDKLIELSQTRLEQAKTYKKAMLQKMFPQQGESVPEIRFKGFSGDWITDQLGKIAKIYRGLTYSPSDITISGLGTRVLRSSNINEDVLVLKENDIFVNSSAVKLENIQCEDILITAANGSTNLVGKHAIIKSELKDTVHGGFMLVLRTKRSFFINAWMSTSEYKRMLQLVQGGNGAIGNLSKPMLERCKLQYPFSEAEQTKIGNFFQTLDQRIEHQTRKLEHYQQLKKAMLQRMFV